MKSDADVQLISTAEAAGKLSVSVQTVQKWMDAGYLEGWRTVGGHRRIVAESVDRFLRERRGPPGQRGGLAPDRVARTDTAVIVDDDDDDLELAARAIARVAPRLKIHRCRDGYEGLLAVGQLRPVLMLTDIVMPAMDGATMLRRVHDSPLRPLAIVATSHYRRDEVAPGARLPQGTLWIDKPIDSTRLAELLAPALAVPVEAGTAL